MLRQLDSGEEIGKLGLHRIYPIVLAHLNSGGLPGLILRAESIDGDYIFTCSSVKNAKVSISGVNKKSTVLEKKKVQAKIVSFCQSPLFYLGGTPNAQNKFYVKEKQLDDSWVISYNPIELE